MDREQEEAVLHITADYVAEVQAGHAPRLSDYLVRYPQYADEIAEFVTYYHAVEADLPGESLVMPSLSERSSVAVGRAWERIERSDRASSDSLATLLAIASRRHLSLVELAVKSGLSQDIIEKLEQRMVAASTLPQELLRRLATIVEVPVGVIAACFGLSSHSQMGESGNVAASLARAKLAESPASYKMGEASDVQGHSFRETIEQSPQLSDEQKAIWRDILSREGL